MSCFEEAVHIFGDLLNVHNYVLYKIGNKRWYTVYL